MKTFHVTLATAVVAAAGVVGAAAPAQAHTVSHASGTSTVSGAAEVGAAAIQRKLYLLPAGIGDTACKNGVLSYSISLDALPNVARSMVFKVAVPRRGVITFDDLDVDLDAGLAWYSACTSKAGYKVISRSKRLKVTGRDYETGRKVTARNVKVYVTDC